MLGSELFQLISVRAFERPQLKHAHIIQATSVTETIGERPSGADLTFDTL
jgi:hypothetical protein